jgi:hypothetical protein
MRRRTSGSSNWPPRWPPWPTGRRASGASTSARRGLGSCRSGRPPSSTPA